ncbi:hypothetical protein LOY37_03715 [Pseudomonas sp. B21-012]|uniref:hypothetical protein n=1 Tax=Pseudomonas sp. B21-012 TaxID=2895472 RepID=UPI0021607FAB|nr:hypothetical protein [Pseudomonas sp. B21-012]UVM56700.1 hypothetical protein LOY37_03715 [Pseudomonas sp. B21-012]
MLAYKHALLLLLLVLSGCVGTRNVETVADRLNERYLNRASECAGGLAAYHCSGVMIRGFESLDLLWNPSESELSRDTVPFSYVRADLGITRLYPSIAGFIVNEFSLVNESTKGSGQPSEGYQLTVRCSFPYDGGTVSRADGCGISTQEEGIPPGSSRPCGLQGINNAYDWLLHFKLLAANHQPNSNCTFKATVGDFLSSLQAHVLLGSLPDGQLGPYIETWNEVVLSAWPREVTRDLPIEAFYYSQGGSPIFARKAQQRFFAETGRLVPIVVVDLEQARPFTYQQKDQIR